MEHVRCLHQELPPSLAFPYDASLWNEPLLRNEVTFVYPENTQAVRAQAYCALDCPHCEGHYLKAMTPLDRLVTKPEKSYLISGGSNKKGQVVLKEYLPLLQELKKNHRLNLHVGLADPLDIPILSAVADVVSFDFVYHDPTIKAVYGLDTKKETFLSTMNRMREHTKVVPHICLGLFGGVLQGEKQAIEKLAEEGYESLVFLVFIPTPNTRYKDCAPPPLGLVVELLVYARTLLPKTRLCIGCMRPKGLYRKYLDAYALLAGLDVIVLPTPLARNIAHKENLILHEKRECCAL